MSWLLVASGSALGALMRHVVIQLIPRNGARWPVATLIVNILGSFAAGALYAVIAGSDGSAQLRLFWLTGVLGGFTAYSAFALEKVILQQRGQSVRGRSHEVLEYLHMLYVVATLFGCLWAARIGCLLAQEL